MKIETSFLIVIAIAASSPVLADDPLAALRAACTDDAKQFCAGVQPGGGRIVACLKEHKDELSDRCRQAAGVPARTVDAVGSSADAPLPPAVTTPGASGGAKAKPASPRKAASATTDQTGITEKFVERVVPDTEHGGLRAATLHVPEKWHFESKLEWHYGWVDYPVSYSAHAENPDNAEAYFAYPMQRFEISEVPPQLKQYDKSRPMRPGERLATGALYSPPLPAPQALAKFIQTVRPDSVNFKWVAQQDLPDLAKALRLDPRPNQHGVAIKVAYDFNGQPVEEAFFGVYYLSQGTNAGVNAGMIKETTWGLQALQSFRAPAGTLDKRLPVFCVVAKSMYVNPQWVRLSKAINDKMVADFNQKLQQGYDQIRAAQAIVAQTMQQQSAILAGFEKQEEAMRSSSVDDSFLRDGGKRSAADHWDDVIRGVDTLNDPNGGTTQLSNLGQYHFTDGFGNYRTSDDPNYTPENAGEVGSWTRMTEAP